ncbi:MAG: hypothetical protein JNL67_09815 [Planctomycetaceae bacterium]|nr:hypothetical protein [Planctomycetaceae bacterium]
MDSETSKTIDLETQGTELRIDLAPAESTSTPNVPHIDLTRVAVKQNDNGPETYFRAEHPAKSLLWCFAVSTGFGLLIAIIGIIHWQVAIGFIWGNALGHAFGCLQCYKPAIRRRAKKILKRWDKRRQKATPYKGSFINGAAWLAKATVDTRSESSDA